MQLSVEVQSANVLLMLRNGEKKVAYAIAGSINAAMKDAQKAMQERMQRVLTIRKPGFMLRQAVIIAPFASAPRRQFAASYHMSDKPRLLLEELERGGTRKPFTPGAQRVAVPNLGGPARPNKESSIQPGYTFAGMGLTAHYGGKKLTKKVLAGRTKSGKQRTRNVAIKLTGEYGRVSLPDAGEGTGKGAIQWKGRNRTFIKPGGVFQRIGPGKKDYRRVWSFVNPYRITPRLGFRATVPVVAKRRFPIYLKAAIKDAFQHEAQRSAGDALKAFANALGGNNGGFSSGYSGD